MKKEKNGFIISSTLYALVIVMILMVFYILYFLISGKNSYNYISKSASNTINEIDNYENPFTEKIFLYSTIYADKDNTDTYREKIENLDHEIEEALKEQNNESTLESNINISSSDSTYSETYDYKKVNIVATTVNDYYANHNQYLVFKQTFKESPYYYFFTIYDVNLDKEVGRFYSNHYAGLKFTSDNTFKVITYKQWTSDIFTNADRYCTGTCCGNIEVETYEIDDDGSYNLIDREIATYSNKNNQKGRCTTHNEYYTYFQNQPTLQSEEGYISYYACKNDGEPENCAMISSEELANNGLTRSNLIDVFKSKGWVTDSGRASVYRENDILFKSADEKIGTLITSHYDDYSIIWKYKVNDSNKEINLNFNPTQKQNNYKDRYYFAYIEINKTNTTGDDTYNFNFNASIDSPLNEYVPLIYVYIDPQIEEEKKEELKENINASFKVVPTYYDTNNIDNAINDAKNKILNINGITE